MLVTDADARLGDRRTAKKKYDALADEAFATIAEKVDDLVFKTIDGPDIGNARFLLEFANGCTQIILPFLDMALGEVPMLSVVQQEIVTAIWIVPENDEAGRTLLSRHAGFYPSVAASASMRPRGMLNTEGKHR